MAKEKKTDFELITSSRKLLYELMELLDEIENDYHVILLNIGDSTEIGKSITSAFHALRRYRTTLKVLSDLGKRPTEYGE